MFLIDLITQHANDEAIAGKWGIVANRLNELKTTIVDTTHWSFGLMMRQGQLSQELDAGVALAIKEAGKVNPLMESAFITLSTTGLQLHTDDRQGMIEAIGVGLPTEAVQAIKSLGIRDVAVVVTTANECKLTWDNQQITSVWNARSAVVAEGIHEGTITTIEQIIAVIGGE